MLSRPAVTLPLVLACVLGVAAPTAPAWGDVTRAEGSTALKVSYLQTGFGNNRLQVLAPTGAILGAGDVIVTIVTVSQMDRFAVYVDPDSAPPASAVKLEPGVGCTSGWPSTSPAPLPFGAVYCSYANPDSLEVEFDLTGSAYTGGELSMINTTLVDGALRGSPHRDVFYGGRGNDSVDGAGGNDVIFGGAGDDWLLGGAGADTIEGEGGSDVIYGDAGPDSIEVDDDKGITDWVNCNNFDPAVIGTDNDPADPPINTISAAKTDRVTDCGEPGAPGNTTPPAFPGTAEVGVAYPASAGTWTGQALIMSYAWFACPRADAPIPFADDDDPGDCAAVFARDGQQGLTYTPRSSDAGKYLVLRSTARNNAGFWTVTTRSAAPVAGKPTADAPTNVKAWVSKGRSRGRAAYFLNASWSPPAYTGTGTIQEYWVQFSGDGGKTWDPTLKVPGNSTTIRWSSSASKKSAYAGYTCRVAAVNTTKKVGDWSRVVDVTQP